MNHVFQFDRLILGDANPEIVAEKAFEIDGYL